MEESILTEDAKKAINSYLLKWMSILGVLNLSAVAAVLVYIFGVLPEQALEKATKSITDNTKQEVQDLRKQLTLATTDALVESGRAKERANKAINDIAMINKQIAPLTKEAAGLKEALGSVEKNKLIQAQRIVDSILESDGSDQYLQKIPSIESRLSSLDKAVMSYGITEITIVDDASRTECEDMASGSKPNRKLCFGRPSANKISQ